MKSIIRFISSLVEVVAVVCNLKHSTKVQGTQSGHRSSGINQASFSVAMLHCPHLGSDLMPGAPLPPNDLSSRRSWAEGCRVDGGRTLGWETPHTGPARR